MQRTQRRSAYALPSLPQTRAALTRTVVLLLLLAMSSLMCVHAHVVAAHADAPAVTPSATARPSVNADDMNSSKRGVADVDDVAYDMQEHTSQTLSTTAAAASYVPVTVYIRTRRQSDDTELTQQQQPQPTTTAAAAAAVSNSAPVELEDELPLPSPLAREEARRTSQHRAQVVRTLPPAYSPRYAVTTSVTVPARQLMLLAAREMRGAPTRDTSDLAIRFAFRDEVQHETLWLPLAVRHVSQTNETTVHYLYSIDFVFTHVTTDDDDDDDGDNDDDHDGDVRTGAARMTSVRVYERYTWEPRTALKLTYVWSRRSAYEPHVALAVCSLCAVVAAALMTMYIACSYKRLSQQFARGDIVVRTHHD